MKQASSTHAAAHESATWSFLFHPLTIALLLVVFAGVLRFVGLGKWSFAGDEVFTLTELDSLFGRVALDPDHQLYKLPRLLPVAYGLMELGTTLFGANEFGSRIINAVLLTLSVGALFLLLDRWLDRLTAVAAALLLATWPPDLLMAQEARFYASAACFGGLSLLTGSLALQNVSAPAAWTSLLFAVAASLSHSVALGLLLLVPGAIIAAHIAEWRAIPRSLMIALAAFVAAFLALLVLHVIPLVRGWNAGALHGYDPVRAIMALVNRFGFPMLALAAVGLVHLLCENLRAGIYWGLCFAALITLSVLLPFVVVYHPAYAVAYIVPVFVGAGYAISSVYRGMRSTNRLTAAGVFLVLCLTNLPGLASHYSDGSRSDYRTAVAFVRGVYQPGDIVASDTPVVPYYIGMSMKTAPLDFAELKGLNKRVWIVVGGGRAGLGAPTQVWLNAETRMVQRFERRRFDYHRNFVDVYLLEPGKPL